MKGKAYHATVGQWLRDDGLETTWRRIIKIYLMSHQANADRAARLVQQGRPTIMVEADKGGDKPDVRYILADKFFTDVIDSGHGLRGEIDQGNNHMGEWLLGLTFGQWAAFYEFTLAHVDRAARKRAGQYFTPDDVAAMMATKAVAHFGQHETALKKLSASNLNHHHQTGGDDNSNKKIWCDPAAGIGNLAYYLIAAQTQPEIFLRDNIFFIDRDPLALFIGRVLLTVAFQRQQKNLFHDIESKFITADFLTHPNLPYFDYALFNPPYGQLRQNDKLWQQSAFATKSAGDLYACFMERVMERAVGFVAITPQSFTHAAKFFSLRTLLLTSGKNIVIYNFDNVPDNIFRGRKFGSDNSNRVNSIRAAITIFHKNSESKNSKQATVSFVITPLLRWRAAERARLFDSIDIFLTPLPLHDMGAAIFPKCPRGLDNLYQQSLSWPRLASLLAPKPTRYFLAVPTTPRYFISAMKTHPRRTSYRLLYFYQAVSRDRAYLLINSSICYWWWRLCDGGMTLSYQTLASLPLLVSSAPAPRLLKLLAQSEKIRRVNKKNAGRDNENVKHDRSLVARLNDILLADCFPKGDKSWGAQLLQLHDNSVLLGKTI